MKILLDKDMKKDLQTADGKTGGAESVITVWMEHW